MSRIIVAERFQYLLNVPAKPPAGTTLHLFAGDAMETVDTVSADLETRVLTPRTMLPGDLTVTRKSALADRRNEQNWTPVLQSPIDFDDVRFLFGDHFALTRDAEFTDNALFLLLEDPTKRNPIKIMEQ